MTRDAERATGSTLLVLLRSPADTQAWAAFTRRYGPKIYGWCRQRGLQEADCHDVSQEVLTKLLRKLPTFAYDPDKGTFRGWLRTLTLHALDDYLDARRRHQAGSGDPAVLEALQSAEARDDLLQGLREAFDHELLDEARERVQLRVSPRDWMLFQALAVEGKASRTVADELGMTVAAVLMAKKRVQDKLRAEIQRLEGEGAAPQET
jgi:RNA polymerase sigma-70 factor (ECF subfamily)